MLFRRARFFAPIVVALASTGCGGSVLFTDDRGEGSGGSAGDAGGAPCGDFVPCEPEPGPEPGPGPEPEPADPTTGIAEPWSVAESWGYAPAPPNTLLLALSSEGPTCGIDPASELPGCSERLTWIATIPLPGELQRTGAVIALEDLLSVGPGPFVSESQGSPDGTCSGGGGTLSGTLEVLAIDGASVTIRLSDTFAFSAPLDGEWTLERCPSGDDPAPEG
jgi:hypothetical protein